MKTKGETRIRGTCMRGFISLSFIFLLFSFLGCGEGKVGLNGKVTFSDDDSPLTVGSVSFETDSFQARGPINSDGTYVVNSTGRGDGLPRGKYRIRITGASEQVGVDSLGMPLMRLIIDPKYASPETSGLELEVTKKTNKFDIVVERAKKP